MRFWVDWELWEKLSLVLAGLITIVLIYAFCVLAYHKWMIRKYAAAEARQKEEEAELHPMLTGDDIPFGARALERGIYVDDIWVSKPNTPNDSPHQPGTPDGSRPASPAPRVMGKPPANPAPALAFENTMTTPTQMVSFARPRASPKMDMGLANYRHESQRPGEIYGPAVTSSFSEYPGSRRRNDILSGNEKRASFHSRLFRTSHLFDKNARTGPDGQDEQDLGSAGNDVGLRNPAEHHRPARLTKTLRRRSSEEFRRKMSQIFNENIQMGVPAEQLQFNPELRDTQKRSKRRSIFGQFRS